MKTKVIVLMEFDMDDYKTIRNAEPEDVVRAMLQGNADFPDFICISELSADTFIETEKPS